MIKAKEKFKIPPHQKRQWVRLVRDCNLRCSFCLDKDAQNGTLVPTPDIINELKIGRSRGITRVVLSGGEATIHPDFIAIVGLARKLGYTHIQTITNGKMFGYKNFLHRAVKAGLLETTFSIHGHTPEVHDELVKVKGSFVQAVTGLTNALKIPGLIVSLDICLNRKNVKHLPEMMDYFVNLGVREFDLLQIIPFGLAWQNRQSLFYNIEEMLPYLRKAFEYSKRPDMHIWTNRFPPRFLEGFENLIQYPGKLREEVLGESRPMFEAYLQRNELMSCHGERCQFCYNNELCQDFVRLKKERRLEAKGIPRCLADWDIYAGQNNATQPVLEMPKDASQASPADAVNFFISHRYHLKSSQCKECRYNNTCQGAPVEHIREFGFESLKPIVG